MRKKLTKPDAANKGRPPSGRDEFIWDTELRGFGVRVSGRTGNRFYVVQRDVLGRTRRVVLGGVAEFADVKAARDLAGKTIQKLRDGIDPKADEKVPTELGAILEDYIDRKGRRGKLSPRTIAGYRDVLRYVPKWKNRPLRDITPTMLSSRYDEVTRTSGPYAANNLARVIRLLARSVKLPDPTEDLDWNETTRREGVIKGDDLPAFVAAARSLSNPVHADYVEFVLVTGLRRTSAASIRWADVDRAGGVIRLPKKVMKGGRSFDLPITDLVEDILIRRSRGGREEYIFPSARGGGLKEPRGALEAIYRATGIVSTAGTPVTVHDLRRTYATIASGIVSGFELKALLHHSLNDARDVTLGYVRIGPDRLARAARLVADEIRVRAGIELPEGVASLARKL